MPGPVRQSTFFETQAQSFFKIKLQYISTVCRMKTKYLFPFCNSFCNMRSDLLINKILCSWRCFNNTIHDAFNIKEVAVRRVETSSNEVLRQICLLGIWERFTVSNSSSLDYYMWFKQGIISLDDWNVHI